ncbi:hypothetical protein SXANM310S_00905 [Streptomyces xanthochromogenes]
MSPATAVALAWTVFLGAHLALNGRWWPWLAVSLLPPPLFAVVPLALLAAAAASESVPGAVLATGCLLAGWRENGLNTHALKRSSRETTGIRVVSWNTQHWNQGREPDRFYAFLHSLPADVYLLQEYLNGFEGGEVWDTRSDPTPERLRREFLGHRPVDRLQLGRPCSRFAGPPVPPCRSAPARCGSTCAPRTAALSDVQRERHGAC